MSGLFRADDGFFPIDDIRSVQHVAARSGRCEHYVVRRRSSEATIDLFTWDMVDLSRRPMQLTAAEPGTKLIAVYVDHEGGSSDVLPVLSWALCLDGFVRPVLPSGVRRGYSEHDAQTFYRCPDYIQSPDGSIYEFGYEAEFDRYDTVEQIIEIERENLRRYEAERAKHEADRLEREQATAA
jgi:hypothetical protein